MAAEKSPQLTRAVAVVCVTAILSVYVKADTLDDHHDDNTHLLDGCGDFCPHGCCQHQCCAEDQSDPDDPSVPSEPEPDTIKIVAVVGGVLIVLILFALCVLRYRHLVKTRERSARHFTSASRRNAAVRHSSIFAMSVPPQSQEHLASRLSNIQYPINESSTAGGQLVLPPPYSPNDPFTSPSYDGDSSDQLQLSEPPPAYADIVKDVVFVVDEETSTQERLPENQPQEENENSASTEPGR